MSTPTKERSAASGLLMELLDATQMPLALTSQIWSSPEKPCASCRKLLTVRICGSFNNAVRRAGSAASPFAA